MYFGLLHFSWYLNVYLNVYMCMYIIPRTSLLTLLFAASLLKNKNKNKNSILINLLNISCLWRHMENSWPSWDGHTMAPVPRGSDLAQLHHLHPMMWHKLHCFPSILMPFIHQMFQPQCPQSLCGRRRALRRCLELTCLHLFDRNWDMH